MKKMAVFVLSLIMVLSFNRLMLGVSDCYIECSRKVGVAKSECETACRITACQDDQEIIDNVKKNCEEEYPLEGTLEERKAIFGKRLKCWEEKACPKK